MQIHISNIPQMTRTSDDVQGKEPNNHLIAPQDRTLTLLTVVSLWGGVSPVMGLGCRSSLSVAAVLGVKAAVVIARLGVFLQLLRQVGPRRAGGNIVFIAVLRNLQLLHKTHWSVRQSEGT